MALALRNAPHVADHKKFPARTVTEQASVQQNNHANGKNSGNKNGSNVKSMWAKILFAALTAIVGNVARKIPDWTSDKWKLFKDWWDGKCIAIIGPTASGKNSLFNKLKGSEAPTTHVQTRGTEEIGTFDFHWPLPGKGEVKFTCRRSINVGGETDERDRYWLESCSGSDVIFYLVDIDRLMHDKKSTIERIKSDAKWISSNINSMKSGSVIQIILNKIDKMSISPDPVNVLEKIESDILPYIDSLEEIFRKILGPNFSKISGISPISMVDGHLFNRYFTRAMQDVFTSRAEKK